MGGGWFGDGCLDLSFYPKVSRRDRQSGQLHIAWYCISPNFSIKFTLIGKNLPSKRVPARMHAVWFSRMAYSPVKYSTSERKAKTLPPYLYILVFWSAVIGLCLDKAFSCVTTTSRRIWHVYWGLSGRPLTTHQTKCVACSWVAHHNAPSRRQRHVRSYRDVVMKLVAAGWNRIHDILFCECLN